MAECDKWCREVVNPAYALLGRAMFQTVERLAATNTKHGDRLRLESYTYFASAISDVGQAVPVLQWHVRQAAAAKQRAMQAYVQQQLEHGKFWKLMEFSMVSCALQTTASHLCMSSSAFGSQDIIAQATFDVSEHVCTDNYWDLAAVQFLDEYVVGVHRALIVVHPGNSCECTPNCWLQLLAASVITYRLQQSAPMTCVELQHVEQLLREVDAEEVPFQMHYQATDLRVLLQTTMHHAEKKVHSMLARVQKHMGTTSPALVADVWPRIQSSLQKQYERLSEQMKLCYNTVQLPLTPSQLNTILTSVTATS